MLKTCIALPLLLFLSLSCCQKIPDSDAYKYIDETKIVCGLVASAKYTEESRGKPTFLDLGNPYPNHTFTVVIWGKNRANFSAPPESLYINKTICVKGKIKLYKGRPEMIINGPGAVSGGE
jgi:hypothetical protein